MESVKKTSDRNTEASTEDSDIKTAQKADLSDTDALLEEIDELLADEVAASEAAEREAYKEKLRSINFIGKRATDPCADVIRVPEFMAEPLLRTGMFKESNCEGC